MPAYASLHSSLPLMLEGFRDSTTSFVALPSGCQDVEQVFENGKYALGDAGKQVFFFSFFFF